jgi:hypothetical protein
MKKRYYASEVSNFKVQDLKESEARKLGGKIWELWLEKRAEAQLMKILTKKG